MKLAVVHQLPLEIYPPVTNALEVFSLKAGWTVRAWSSGNHRGLPDQAVQGVNITRPVYPGPQKGKLLRLVGFLGWHLRVALDLARWKPDVVISIEPHSALGVWFYYRLFRSSARLLIHHHEYYAPADFLRPGNHTSRLSHRAELAGLFQRAEWVSQTNADRLQMMRDDLGVPAGDQWQIWPNYPPSGWRERAGAVRTARGPAAGSPLRLVYVGSLSFEDTFVREAVNWVASHPEQLTLHVCGYNIKPDVAKWIESLALVNVTIDARGCRYSEQPELLAGFDVALVLYKGNTLNFVYNIPNKVVEALVCGLEVWFPGEMLGLSGFAKEHPALPLRSIDFGSLEREVIAGGRKAAQEDLLPFCNEAAIQPLLQRLERSGSAPV